MIPVAENALHPKKGDSYREFQYQGVIDVC
jgi:hypothetical protein